MKIYLRKPIHFNRKLVILTIFLSLIIFTSMVYFNEVKAERPNYVYDWEDLLTDDEEAKIEAYCLKVDENITAEIVIISIKTFDGKTKEQASLYYFNDYLLDGVKGIGKAGKDNGVLILVSLTENAWRIEVGYGVEGDLTDAECGRIGRDILVKYLVKDENFNAFYKTVEAIAKELGYGASETKIIDSDIFDVDFIFVLIAVGVILFCIAVLALMIAESGGYGGGWSSGGSGGGGRGGGGGFGGGGSGGGGAGGGIR